MRTRVANTQAAMPSDDALVAAAKHISNGMGGGGLMRALRPGAADMRAADAKPQGWDIPGSAKMVGGPGSQPPPPPVAVDVEPYVPTLRDAVASAQPFVWPVGFNVASQKLAAFNMLKHHHAGIVGSSGTGKTTGVGFLMVSHALRQGVHTVLVDGDGGASWAGFAPYAEHIPADDYNLRDIFNTLEKEMDRRVAVLAERNLLTWEQAGGGS